MGMGVTIREMRVSDLLEVRRCNVRNLPENYQLILYMYTIVVYSETCFVAEDSQTGEVVGYIMGKMKDEFEEDAGEQKKDACPIGYIMSLCVDREYRGWGIASGLVSACIYGLARRLLQEGQGAAPRAIKVLLNVRVSNSRAISIYRNRFGFSIEKEDAGYYPDKENAYLMSRVFSIAGQDDQSGGVPAGKRPS